MPSLLVEDVPVELYERIQEQARTKNRSISSEIVILLGRLLEEEPSPQAVSTRPEAAPQRRRLVDPPFLTEETSPPQDLPRPGPGVRVRARDGGRRLPDLSSLPKA